MPRCFGYSLWCGFDYRRWIIIHNIIDNNGYSNSNSITTIYDVCNNMFILRWLYLIVFVYFMANLVSRFPARIMLTSMFWLLFVCFIVLILCYIIGSYLYGLGKNLHIMSFWLQVYSIILSIITIIAIMVTESMHC